MNGVVNRIMNTNVFNSGEVILANKSCRDGQFAKNRVVLDVVRQYAKKSDLILDFGSGRYAMQASILKKEGYNVIAYDFGNNVRHLHDVNALTRKYDVVYASNVLNVQSSIEMLNTTLEQIQSVVKKRGKVIFNYPKSPRYLDLNDEKINGIMVDHFEVIQYNKSKHVWVCRLPL